jgi:NAD(P)H-dependent FMN reductase
VAWVNVSPRGAGNAHESLRKVLGYVHAVIVVPACLAVPVSSAMVQENGLVEDPEVVRVLLDSLERLAAACSS